MTSSTSYNLGMAAYRAPSLFQPHRTRQALRDAHEGKIPPLMGLYLGLSTVPTARFIAPLGVPGHDHAAIGFALDAGANIVIPQVNTVKEAQHVVSATKYGTKHRGTRSAPPFRLVPGVSDTCIDSTTTIHENVNNQAAIMLQIETLEGVNNLDAILTEVPDIDAIWLGSLDMRVSMGLLGWGGPSDEPEFLEAVEKFETVLRKHDMPRGGLAIGTPEMKQALGKDNCMSFVAADVMALGGMVEDLMSAKAMFPAERKMVPKSKVAETNGHSHVITPLRNGN
ncbi:hypothetical protein P7C71_g4323, partial [Lecanoromycetidae sp. Uapishka_2]